jgi:uncharacterized membrane protein
MARAKRKLSFTIQLRLLLALVVAGIVIVLLPDWVHLPTRLLSAWDAAMICLLTMTWWVMVRATPDSMRRKAQQQDASRLVILSLITAAACVSVLAIAFMLRDNKHAPPSLLAIHLSLAILTIVGSWLLVHTIFALHYAHGYYQDQHKTLQEAEEDGLDFPREIEPDYWDFLYFSFVIGMTSQVSDVQVTSRSLRRLALLHGVLSFFFNAMILAMSINIIAGMIQGAS